METARQSEIQVKSPENNNAQAVFAEIKTEPDLRVLNGAKVLLVDTPLTFERDKAMPTGEISRVAENIREASVTAFARHFRLSETDISRRIDISLVADDMSVNTPVYSLKSGNAEFSPKAWDRLVSKTTEDKVELKVFLILNP